MVADTYANFGLYKYENHLDSDGFIGNITEKHSGSHTPLYKVQRTLAEEQAQGYELNARANAASAASSMLGTAIGADYEGLFKDPDDAGATDRTGDQLMSQVQKAIEYLNDEQNARNPQS